MPRVRKPYPNIVAQKVADSVAVMAGSGKPAKEIALAVRRSERRVQQILHQEMTPERRELMERARAEVQEKMLALSQKHLETMDDAFKEGHLGHQSQAMRVWLEGAGVGGYARGGVAPAVGVGGVSINFGDAATMASFVEALRLLNEPKAIDVTPVREE
jgi:hypothetical protein